MSALLGGCGSAQSGSSDGAVASRRAAARAGDAERLATVVKAPAGAQRRLSLGASAARASGPASVAAAEAFARAVNLTAADVPGAVARKSTSHSETRSERQYAKQAIAKCLSVERTHEIVDISSPEFERGAGIEGESFTSSVIVFSHPAEVEREFSAVRRSQAQACLAHRLRKLVRTRYSEGLGQAHLGAVHITWLHLAVPGAAASAGLRVEITIVTARRTTVPLYVDQFGFALGSAEVEFTASSYIQPLASTVEQDLLSLLVARARADEL